MPFGGSARVDVVTHPTETEVAAAVCAHIETTAQAAIAANGYFTIAVPGGSALKVYVYVIYTFISSAVLRNFTCFSGRICKFSPTSPHPRPCNERPRSTQALKGLAAKKSAIDWSKVHVLFVNHKSSIKLDDPSSTFQRVKDFFGTAVGLPVANIVAPLGSGDAAKDAEDYVKKLKATAVKLQMPTTAEGIPRVDMMLIGVGGDGHIGSLYANKPQTTDLNGPW